MLPLWSLLRSLERSLRFLTINNSAHEFKTPLTYRLRQQTLRIRAFSIRGTNPSNKLSQLSATENKDKNNRDKHSNHTNPQYGSDPSHRCQPPVHLPLAHLPGGQIHSAFTTWGVFLLTGTHTITPQLTTSLRSALDAFFSAQPGEKRSRPTCARAAGRGGATCP